MSGWWLARQARTGRPGVEARRRVRMRSCAALLTSGLVAAGLVACGITADYSGLQGGALAPAGDGAAIVDLDAGGASDASSASGQGPTDTGLRDASDANDSNDSGTGDAVAPDASTGFCATLATPVKLCTDFDEGEPVEAGWGATDLYGGEAISLSTIAFSAPSSFLSAVNPSGAPSSARLLQVVPVQSPHVHVEFEMLLVPSTGTYELGAIHQVTPDGTTYGLYYREVSSALQVELRSLASDGTLFDQSWPIGAPPSTWTRVDLDLDVSDAGTFEVQQDGVPVLTETNEPTSTPSRTQMFVEIGFYTFDPGSGSANFDNTIVDWP